MLLYDIYQIVKFKKINIIKMVLLINDEYHLKTI